MIPPVHWWYSFAYTPIGSKGYASHGMASVMIDVYLSGVSNRMNEFMKGPTIIATIFIPLSCFVGICGVNYKYMPELKWCYGYLLLRLIMLDMALTMLVLFRRMIWF